MRFYFGKTTLNPQLILLLGAFLILRLGLIFSVPLADPTEGRYAEVSRQMVVGGDWVTPRIWINGELIPFLGKPPLHFWLAALSIRGFGSNEFAVRLPGCLAAILTLLLTFGVLKRYEDRRTALLATLIGGTSLGFFLLSGASIVDMTLTLCTTGPLLAYFAFLREPDCRLKKRWSLLVFLVRKTPYSAHFYGQDRIVPHPKESPSATLQRGKRLSSSPLYIMDRKYLKGLSEEQRGQLQLLATSGVWRLFHMPETELP
jgi:hypothetical protein